ncbi:protein TolQ [Pseudomonadota bacterium]
MENAINDTGVAMFDLILQADIVIKTIAAALILASIWSWTIVFDKIVKFRILTKRNKDFEKLFWSGQMLEDIYTKVRNNANHPTAMIFVAAMQEWETTDIVSVAKGGNDLKKSLKDRLENVMYIALSRATEKLRRGLGFLGIVASTATFFGLFGTVWGIMHSFQAIAGSQNTSLTVIAPGIAGALLTTIIGLFAAVPALIFYNLYNQKIHRFAEGAENFMYELLTILSRELDQ